MTATLTQVDLTRRNHRRAVRFVCAWLILATWVSLAGQLRARWRNVPIRYPVDSLMRRRSAADGVVAIGSRPGSAGPR